MGRCSLCGASRAPLRSFELAADGGYSELLELSSNVVFAVAKMNILGIALIVIGFALLCSGLIFYRSSEEPEEGEQATREANGAGAERK